MSRSGEVTAKLARVPGWLDEADYDAALFSSQPGVAWVTAGLEDRVVRNEEPALVWALVTASQAWLVTTNIEQQRILAEEDTGPFLVHAAAEPPASLRMPLTSFEAERMGCLGSDTAHALEGAMRAWHPAERECDLAARIAAA